MIACREKHTWQPRFKRTILWRRRRRLTFVTHMVITIHTRFQIINHQTDSAPKDLCMLGPPHRRIARHAFPIHHVLCRRPSLSRSMRFQLGDIPRDIVIIIFIRVRVQKVLLCHLPPSQPSSSSLLRACGHERGKWLAERASMRPTRWCRAGKDGDIVIDGERRRASIRIGCTMLRGACVTGTGIIMGARRRRAWENARRPRWHMDALINAGEGKSGCFGGWLFWSAVISVAMERISLSFYSNLSLIFPVVFLFHVK